VISAEHIEEISAKISAAMPSGLKQLQSDMEKNIRVILQSSFSKLDLVSRDEFDIQARLLERTREKLSELERRLDELSQ